MGLKSDQDQAVPGLTCQGKEIMLHPIEWSGTEALREGCSMVRFAGQNLCGSVGKMAGRHLPSLL